MELKELLKKYKAGEISEEDLMRDLRLDHLETLEGRFKFDLARESRAGFPEAILALRKTPEDIAGIIKSVLPKKSKIFVTRLDPDKMQRIRGLLEAEGGIDEATQLEYHECSGLLVAKRNPDTADLGCSVGVVAAGTSDLPIAEEAQLICEESGLNTIFACDVGVAGLHRIFPSLKEMIDQDVDVIIVVAGMEGALPSVVKGLVDVPVIGVPTSVGYGYKGGESALISMLNSCVPGLLVTNIDNGFGAAAAAYIICSRISRFKKGGG
jgi:NCAIR mutase (PurE)-related protein